MKTIINEVEYYKLNQEERDDLLKEAGRILQSGGLVAFPTETVYGLGADALNEDAARKTYEAKGRPSDNPLIVHISKIESLEKIVEEVPEVATVVAKQFWPGPLTMVFKKNHRVPYGTTGGLETVAVRMPDHVLARAVIEAGGGYVSAPSANSSGRPSPTMASHVAQDLSGKIDMIIHEDQVDIGVESTILDVTVDPPMILRPGAITKEMLEEYIETVVIDRGIVDENSKVAPKAPGMKYRHYAPKATLTIVDGDIEECVELVNQLTKEKENQGYKVGVIATEESLEKYQCSVVKCVGSRKERSSIAHNLYGVLRDFDDEDVDYIYSEAFFTDGIGYAIMNRLLKAAGNRVIKADKKRG